MSAGAAVAKGAVKAGLDHRVGWGCATADRYDAVCPGMTSNKPKARRAYWMRSVDAIEFLLDKLRSTKNNADFFDQMNT